MFLLGSASDESLSFTVHNRTELTIMTTFLRIKTKTACERILAASRWIHCLFLASRTVQDHELVLFIFCKLAIYVKDPLLM